MYIALHVTEFACQGTFVCNNPLICLYIPPNMLLYVSVAE